MLRQPRWDGQAPVSALAFCTLSLSTAVLGGVPECHYDMFECTSSFNPHFSDLVMRRFDGDFKVIADHPENQEVYCNLDNWIKRSELCGPCAYTFEFTSGVPAEYIGLQHCIGALEKAPYIEESNIDIASPYNGREMRVVTHGVGAGCRTSDYGDANLTDTIAFYNYMDSYGCGGGLAGGAYVQRKLGNRLSVLMFTFHRVLMENMPFAMRASARGIEDVVLMEAKSEAQDLPILKLLRAAAGEVRGKITYHCGADHPRGNPEADLSQFAGGTCPWWFLGEGMCRTSPDPAKRLCASCPLMLHNPATQEELGCLWQPELAPMRRHNNMADMLDFPLQEKVLFIDSDTLPSAEHLCDYENWDAPLVRGRIVVFSPPDVSLRCSRPDYAFHMMRAGVRAWVLLVSKRLHGVGRNVRLPIGSMKSPGHARAAHTWLRDTGVRVANHTYEAEVLFRVPPPVVWNDTPALPLAPQGLTVDTQTKALLEEPVAVAGIVAIPLLVAVLGYSRRLAIPLPSARGVPLGLSSTLLSTSLAVSLAAVTFILADSTGKEAEKAQRDNKDEAVRVIVLREARITSDLTSLYLQTIVGALFVSLQGHQRRMLSTSAVWQALAPFEEEAPTYANWERRLEFLLKSRTTQMARRYTAGIVLQVFLNNGYYADDGRIVNDPDVPMLNGTNLTLRDTNQPYLYPLRMKDGPRFEPSVHNPFKRLWWSDIPPQFGSVVEMNNAPFHGAMEADLRTFISDYQVSPITLHDVNGQYRSPFFTQTRTLARSSVRKVEGVITVSFPCDELAIELRQAIGDDRVRNPLAENMTFVVYTEDGVVVALDMDRTEAWRADSFGGTSALGQQGFQLFTLFDSPQWEFNAYAHFLLSEHGRLDPKDGSGEVLVDTFRARDYYRGYRTEWLWFPFDGAVGETGWHVWDAWMECKGGGSGCFRFEAGHNGNGQALYLDGTGAVRVSPYLTQRVPRVARRRVVGVAGYQSTLDYYNHSLPWGGVPDVIVTQRNLRPSVQGERWQPVEREKMFVASDYSVSMWVKRTADTKGLLLADSVAPNTNLRIYEDGSVVMSVVSYGCRTAAVRNLPVGEWVFLTATVRFARRRSMGHCAMYINGVRRTKSPTYKRAMLTTTAMNYSIGHGFKGHIDDLRVHNLTLSPEQVQQLMREGDARWVPDRELTFALHVDEQVDPANKGSDKTLFVAAILPQEDIVRESQENAAAMSAVVAAQDRVTQDNLERRNNATWLLLAAIITGGILFFVIYNAALARPFAQFARDISRVAHIEVEGIEAYPSNASLLQELNVMRDSVNILVGNMKAFKRFMPLAMQQTVQGHPVSSSEGAGSDADTPATSETPSWMDASLDESKCTLTLLSRSLAERRMGFLLANFVGFHSAATRDAGLLARHHEYIRILVEVSTAHRGLPDTFSGDRMLVTFNGARVNTSFRECAAQTGITAAKALASSGVMVSMSAVAGTVFAGHIGTDSMMRYSTIGPCLTWLYHMERYARRHSIPVLTDNSIFEPCAGNFVFRHILAVVTDLAPSPAPLILTQVLRAQGLSPDEWMYQLEEAHANEHKVWNEVLVALMHHKWSDARSVFASLPNSALQTPSAPAVKHMIGNEKLLAPCCGSLCFCGKIPGVSGSSSWG